MKSSHCRRTNLRGLPYRFLAMAGLIGFQVTLIEVGHTQSTPAIPEAQPSPSSTAVRPEELPQHGTRNEIQPLIPQGQLPSPTPSPLPGASPGSNQVVGGITDQQAAEFDQKFGAALAVIKQIPPGLVPISLLEQFISGSQRTKICVCRSRYPVRSSQAERSGRRF